LTLQAALRTAGLESDAIEPMAGRMKEQELMFPAWQRPYLVALAPGSPETLRDRVAKAKKAILERLAKW